MKTVFITGAGASKPFGFPLGTELLTKIDNSLRENALKVRLNGLGFSEGLLVEFRDILRYGRFSTIDALLEAKKRFREVGGYLIAEAILDTEHKDKIFPVKDWYLDLYNILFKNFEAKGIHDVSFVTLNYDRSLRFLFDHVSKYECHDQYEAGMATYLQGIPIFHAHGTMGTLNEIPYGLKNSDRNHKLMHNAGRNVQIISDNLKDSENFQNARTHLRDANRIIFLGLAYHPSTMKDLFDGIKVEDMELFGTGLKLGDERKQYLKEWSKGKFTLVEHEAVKFMKSITL